MKFEEFSQKDILQLFNLITKEMDQMFFLVDHAYRIQYINRAFGEYVKKDISEIIDKEFGEALGCGNIFTDQKNCAFTSYCKTCEIRKNLHQVFDGLTHKVEFDMVREFKILDEVVVRHLSFKLVPIVLHSERFALCLVDDKRNDDEMAMMINPNASI